MNGTIIFVMGVSGCGKSTVAELIANGLHGHYRDGDELHPAANINKMSRGEPLTDDDRRPWLQDVQRYAAEQSAAHRSVVIACSALKLQYRTLLRLAGFTFFVHLTGSKELIAGRMQERTGHFMPPALLDSQYAALEDPTEEPRVITVSIDGKPAAIAADAIGQLQAHTEFR